MKTTPRVDLSRLPYAIPRHTIPRRRAWVWTDTKGLSRREVEILKLKAMGMINSTVAHELQISEQTVKNHLSSAYRKLNVTNMASAYVELGWLRVPGVHGGKWIQDDPQLLPSRIQRQTII